MNILDGFAMDAVEFRWNMQLETEWTLMPSSDDDKMLPAE